MHIWLLTMLLTFAAGPTAARPVRFALVSDTHISAQLRGEQADYRTRFERVVDAVNAASVDAVLLAGDLTEGGSDGDFAEYARLARRLRKPVLAVAGNHDVGNKAVPDGEGHATPERVARFERAVGPSYFARAFRGVRVIGINASLFGSGLPQEDAQWAFLQKELARRRPTILLTHYPPFLKTQDEPGDPYWNMEPGPRARLLALLPGSGTLAVLAGHLHRPLELRSDGVLYCATPPVSFGLPRGKQSEGWTLVSVWPDGRVETEFRRATADAADQR